MRMRTATAGNSGHSRKTQALTSSSVRAERRETGRSFRVGADRAGSEPLVERDWVHESGYGGKGGAPRTSSDQRETAQRASGASSADASEAIDERPLSPAASSDTDAPDRKASRSK